MSEFNQWFYTVFPFLQNPFVSIAIIFVFIVVSVVVDVIISAVKKKKRANESGGNDNV